VATSTVATHHDCVSSILKDIQEICVASQALMFEEKNPRIRWLISGLLAMELEEISL
jgi:hypothetical protein